MSAIDQVIARARQGDVAFSERKQFKLARRRAIEKLRKFALADPYFYILEIIQAAVANGAQAIEIVCEDGDVLVSWVGGYLHEDELAQLFDFLFASKDRLDLAHVRSLALGVNALLLFEPTQVVIESGNGEVGGTTRMVVRAGADEVDIGKAEGRFRGTYVRATKLNRRKAADARADAEGSRERTTIETRCLTAPVPIVFNSESMFGWSRQRVFGTNSEHSLVFDEGDLYGTIHRGGQRFKLLTHGVWIQDYEHDFGLGQRRFGGTVCFDRLHKTVDHSGFVRDERFEELWVRLRPYAEALAEGKPVETAQITSANGLSYTGAELRALLQQRPRVVVLAPKYLGRGSPSKREIGEIGKAQWRAEAIARLLDAELLRAEDGQVSAIRVLGDRHLRVWRPKHDDDYELLFYNREPLPAPALPHLLPPAQLEPPTLDALVGELSQVVDGGRFRQVLEDAGLLDDTARRGTDAERLARQLRVALGETGSVRATLYSPADPGPAAGGLLVRVTTTERLLGERLFASPYPGRVLDVELPTAQPAVFAAVDLAPLVAERFAARALPSLREQDQRALAGLGVGKIEAGSAAAKLALQVLARLTVTRLRSARPGSAGAVRLRPGLSFSLLHPVAGFDPFTLPLLRTLAGGAVSLRDLALLSDDTGGLVYGTIPEVPADLDGLDVARILDLDASSEQLLIGMLGESGYVRVDARDELARIDGVVVRDVAVGLRDYPDHSLLLEGEVEALDALAPEDRQRVIRGLVAQLRARMVGEADEPGVHPLILEEHRRQAVRHLQWIACRELVRSETSVERWGLLDLPLFVDLDGEVWSLRAVAAALRSADGLQVHYGHGLGKSELGSLSAAARRGAVGQRPSGERPASVAVSAFGYRLLAPLGKTRLAFDFDLDDAEAAGNPTTPSTAFLVEERWSDAAGSSVIGVPAQRLPQYRIQLRARARGAIAALDELAHTHGIVGAIEIADDVDAEKLYTTVLAHANRLLERLIAKLPTLADDPRRYEAALRTLLTYTGEQLGFVADTHGLVTRVATPLAMRILGLPLFDLGGPTLASGHQLVERFRREFDRGLSEAPDGRSALATIDWGASLAPSSPAIVREWLDTHLQPAAVALPASSAGAQPSPASVDASRDDLAALERWDRGSSLGIYALEYNLERWIAELRPDPYGPTRVRIATHDLPDEALADGGLSQVWVAWAHPLVQRLAADPSPENLAWVLLGVYAFINAAAASVLNSHESAFHLRVGEALLDGRLAVVVQPSDA